jgi:hypothetical protein
LATLHTTLLEASTTDATRQRSSNKTSVSTKEKRELRQIIAQCLETTREQLEKAKEKERT